ncbi:cell division protein FtsA, partial [Arthrospira platensis SPKY2]
EILEHVYFEIRNSGMEKQLIAGVVLTGGGAQLKHLKQLVEYMTGMSARIGYPNEHIAKSAVEDVTSPLHATGVGLVMKGFDYLDRRRPRTVDVNVANREPV